MSIETTQARAEARYQAGQWKAHQFTCGPCGIYAKHPSRATPCQVGWQIVKLKRAADADLKRNRELDKQPAPDQEAMF